MARDLGEPSGYFIASCGCAASSARPQPPATSDGRPAVGAVRGGWSSRGSWRRAWSRRRRSRVSVGVLTKQQPVECKRPGGGCDTRIGTTARATGERFGGERGLSAKDRERRSLTWHIDARAYAEMPCPGSRAGVMPVERIQHRRHCVEDRQVVVTSGRRPSRPGSPGWRSADPACWRRRRAASRPACHR